MDTKKLRQKIFDLAIRGKLVPQDPNDEPASVLLERIRAEKEQLIKEGKIKRSKKSAASDTSHYENVPFEVPGNWYWVKVADISSVIVYGVSESAKSEGKYKLLRITDIQDNAVNWNTVPYTDYPESKSENYILQAGDILFARTGATVGKSYLVDDAVPENAIYASYLIKVRVSNMIIPQYVKYFFESGLYWEQIANNSVGVGQPNVNGSSLGNLWVPIPPIQEQRRIVDKLVSWCLMIDKISVNQELITQQIEELRNHILNLAISGKLVAQEPSNEPAIELLKRINPIFSPTHNRHYANVPFDLPKTWQLTKLKDLCVFLSRGKSPKYSETDKTYPVFAQKCNLKDGGISLEHARFLDPTTVSKWKDVYKLQDGDILINSTGTGTVCRTRLFKTRYLNNYPFVVPDSHVSVIRLHKLISPEYAYIVLSSNASQSYMMDNLAGSTNQKELYISVLENLIFPVPPIEEQRRIVYTVKKISEYIDKIAAAL